MEDACDLPCLGVRDADLEVRALGGPRSALGVVRGGGGT